MNQVQKIGTRSRDGEGEEDFAGLEGLEGLDDLDGELAGVLDGELEDDLDEECMQD